MLPKGDRVFSFFHNCHIGTCLPGNKQGIAISQKCEIELKNKCHKTSILQPLIAIHQSDNAGLMYHPERACHTHELKPRHATSLYEL